MRVTLRDILQQDYADFDVIVVDNGSTDGTDAMLAAEFPGVTVVKLERNLGTKARRTGVEGSSGEYVILYDDDSGPSSATDIRCMIAYFTNHPEAAVVCTRVHHCRFAYDETWEWERFAARGSWEEGYEGLFLHGSGVAFRRQAVLETEVFGDDLFWGD